MGQRIDYTSNQGKEESEGKEEGREGGGGEGEGRVERRRKRREDYTSFTHRGWHVTLMVLVHSVVTTLQELREHTHC